MEMLIAVFTVTLLGNLSPFPTPYVVVIFLVGGKMNPFLVGFVASIAAVIGEVTSYLLGRGGRAVAKESVENTERLEKMKMLGVLAGDNDDEMINNLGKEKFIGAVINQYDMPTSRYYGYRRYSKYYKKYSKRNGEYPSFYI